MALVGRSYLVYVASASFREVAEHFVNLDDYGAIYAVTTSSHEPKTIKPSQEDLSAAHWTMFLALIANYPELKRLSELRGFSECWDVHWLDIQSGEDLVSDARSLTVD